MTSYEPRVRPRLACSALAVLATVAIGLFIHRLARNDPPVEQMATSAHVALGNVPSKVEREARQSIGRLIAWP
jgi:hypothetical protein